MKTKTEKIPPVNKSLHFNGDKDQPSLTNKAADIE